MAGLRQLGRDSLVYGILDVANRFIALLLLPLYTRVLAPADYGRLDLAFTISMMAIAALTLGLDQALLYRFNTTDDPAEQRRVVTTATVSGFGIMTAGALLLAVASEPLGRMALPGVPGAQGLVLLVAAGLPLQSVHQVNLLMLRVRRDFRRYATLSLGALISVVALNAYLLLVLRMGAEGVLLAQAVCRVPAAIYGLVVNRREFAPLVSPALARKLVVYGAPLMLGTVSYWGLMFAERYALARLGPLSEVGIYGLATRIAMLVSLVSVAIDTAWMPFAHSIQRDPDAPRTYSAALGWYVLAAGAVGTLLAIFAREALVVAATPAYYPAFVLVGPMVASLVVHGAFNLVAVGALVTRRTYLVSVVILASAAADLVLLALLVPRLGAMGAVLATLLARLGAVGLLVGLTRRAYPVPYPWSRIARMAAVFAAAVAGGVVLSRLDLWTGAALKALVLVPATALACVATGAVRRSDMAGLLGLLRARARAPRAVEGS